MVLYPYITGLVAGAFILASLERVFKVKVLRPTYQLALLTALAFLICAPLPLVSHLGQPGRAYEIMITPHAKSAMAIFGFVYLFVRLFRDFGILRDVLRRRNHYVRATMGTGDEFSYRAFRLFDLTVTR